MHGNLREARVRGGRVETTGKGCTRKCNSLKELQEREQLKRER